MTKNTSKPIIRVNNLYKIYRGGIEVAALQGITLQIHQGEVVSIEGVSGSGKTTLLQCIGGLLRPTMGSVYVGNTNIISLSDRQLVDFRKKDIGFVFQENNLFPRMSVLDNILFPQIIAGTPIREPAAKAFTNLSWPT